VPYDGSLSEQISRIITNSRQSELRRLLLLSATTLNAAQLRRIEQKEPFSFLATSLTPAQKRCH
jgi:hypothetical protein